MAPKAIFKTLKLEKVSTKAANLLKQTFLAKGGEVAVARGTADLSVEFTDVLICATMKQYNMSLAQLRMQPWGLPKIADAISNALKANDKFPFREFRWTGKKLLIQPRKTLVMGILNLTPDSFSDGGKYNNIDHALKKAEEMVHAGADIIDIGAESTRPGFVEVPENEEIGRMLPVLEKLAKTCVAPISIDTYKASVAKAALDCGANIINDIWGLQKDPNMANIVAAYNVPVIIMHNRLNNEYQSDIMADICNFLSHSISIGISAGIRFENIITDPGIGFAKNGQQNLVVMSRLDELKSLGCPILLGTSRKRFIGEVLDLPVEDRVEGTAATVAVGITKGANIVRVHDVESISRIAKMTDVMIRGDLFD
ncbi:hypothetical protein SDC9_119266 [bioreactor metagenome]|uniref:dihydropteroate synthase n=1 Tax=bioreactor metagenome TaxID=1076179 RepID=A0A645C8L6_9ZZZZ